jgi:hypothetical protein
MALKSLSKTSPLLSCLLLLSIIEIAAAFDPPFAIFVGGTAVMAPLGILVNPIVGLCIGIPLMVTGIIGMELGDTFEKDDNQLPSFPTVCSAGIILISPLQISCLQK